MGKLQLRRYLKSDHRFWLGHDGHPSWHNDGPDRAVGLCTEGQGKRLKPINAGAEKLMDALHQARPTQAIYLPYPWILCLASTWPSLWSHFPSYLTSLEMPDWFWARNLSGGGYQSNRHILLRLGR